MAKSHAHPTPLKKKNVAYLQEIIEQYPVIALVDMQNLPSLQLQRMRASLRGRVALFMTKKNLISLALDRAEKKKPGVIELKKYIKGMPAILATKDDAFSMASALKKSRSMAFAKAGQVAPHDIIIPAGPTSFSPGPIIGELGSARIKAGIEAGKVVIKDDCKVLSEGDVVSAHLAGILMRLNIEPMEIGLNLLAAFEDGFVYTKSVLEVDEKAYHDNLYRAASDSLHLALTLCYPTTATLPLLLIKAHRDALHLAEAQDILTSATVSSVLAKANRQMEALQSKVTIEGDTVEGGM